jgi:para-nitrobenzyl esterase
MANDIATADAGLAPIVEIAAGKLRGASSAGICSFKGIPYGDPTAGRGRFMAPEPPQPWSGVREAIAYTGRAW